MIKKVFLNTGAQIAGKIITASMTLLLTVIVGRSLGPVGYGDFVKIFTFVGYFYIFSDFGLNQSFIKLTHKTNKNGLIQTLAVLRIIFALTLIFLAITISLLLPYDKNLGTGFSPQVKLGIAIASVTILSQATLTTLNAFFQLKLRYDLSTIAAIAGSLTTLLATTFVYLKIPSLNAYASAYVLGTIVVVFCAWFLVKNKLKATIKPSFNKFDAKTLISQAWPVGIALILNMIYFRSDILILTYTRPPAEVGIYGLAYQFFEATLAVPIFFANSLFPILTKLHLTSESEFETQKAKWFKLLFLVSIIATFSLAIASFLIPALFDKFQGSQNALLILSAGLPFFFLTAYLWHLAIISNSQKVLIPVYMIGGIINVILNFIFIPIYGFAAAAFVTVFSEAFITLLLFLFVPKIHKSAWQTQVR